MSSSVRTSSCTIEAGLYTIRYASSNDEIAPRALVVLKSGDMQLIPAPGRHGGELKQPGQCLAVLATTAGVIDIVVDGGRRAITPHASFSVDMLDRGDAPAMRQGTVPHEAESEREESGTVSLTIGAHVSRLGDVNVSEGEWVAGPESPLPIEGLSLSVERNDLGVEMQTRSARSSGDWSAWSLPGQFAGTKQRAESLTGLRLRLTGRGANERVIAVEALFLGSSVLRKIGRVVEVSGYDPLVGLKIDILPSGADVVEHTVAPISQVRVFRAKSRG